MLSTSFDPYFLADRGQREGERRVRERHSMVNLPDVLEVQYFPLPDAQPSTNTIVLLDESGHPFVLRNHAGEDTALVVSRCSYVVAPASGDLDYGPRVDTIFYPAPISRLAADLNSMCALTFGGRMPYRHADTASFGEKVDARAILDLISKHNMWAQIRSLWSSGMLHRADIVLVDGALNVVQTPATASADEIAGDLHASGIILAGLSKTFAPKCADIVARGRTLYPGQAFIFTIPPARLRAAHRGADEHEMIFRLGPRGRTIGLTFGIALSTHTSDLEYHGLYVSYWHNEPHRQAVHAEGSGSAVKVYDSVPLSPAFIADVLIPLGARLVQHGARVVSPNYPLPAGAVHSHVLFTADDLWMLVQGCLAGMLEGGETLHHIEHDSRQPHDAVDVVLNRFFRR